MIILARANLYCVRLSSKWGVGLFEVLVCGICAIERAYVIIERANA